MHEINLNDISRYFPVNKSLRLLFYEEKQTRDLKKINQEYDLDKYLPILEKVKNGQIRPDRLDVRYTELGKNKDSQWCFVSEGKYFLGSVNEMLNAYDSWVYRSIKDRIGMAKTVIELGSGYGHHLHFLAEAFPDVNFVGCDISENGIKLGNIIFDKYSNVDFINLDISNEIYEPIKKSNSPILIFTCFSITQLNKSQILHFIKQLGLIFDKISSVVNLEPVFEGDYNGDSLISHLRYSYAKKCGYETGLLPILKDNKKIELLSAELDVEGPNPLCPASLIHWKFS